MQALEALPRQCPYCVTFVAKTKIRSRSAYLTRHHVGDFDLCWWRREDQRFPKSNRIVDEKRYGVVDKRSAPIFTQNL